MVCFWYLSQTEVEITVLVRPCALCHTTVAVLTTTGSKPCGS